MVFALDNDVVSIGRDQSCDIQISDVTCSRIQCRIYQNGDVYHVKDNNSFNGTIVNDARADSAELRAGDVIRVGKTHIRFEKRSDAGLIDYQTSDGDVHLNDSESSLPIVLTEIGLDIDPKSNDDKDVEPIESEAVKQQFQSSTKDLNFFYKASLAIAQMEDRRSLFRGLLDLVLDWLGTEQGIVVLLDDDLSKFSNRVAINRNTPSETEIHEVRYNRRLIDQVIRSRASAMQEFRVNRGEGNTSSPADENLVTIQAICCPIATENNIFGVIYVDTFGTPDSECVAFTRDKLQLMIAISSHAAIKLEHQALEAERIAQERFAAVGELTSVISHRVNNILQIINGGSYLIDVGMESSDYVLVDKGWQIVKRNQNRITRLTTNLLAYSRVFEPNPSTCDLCELVNQALENVGESFDISQISVRHNEPEDSAAFVDSYFTVKVFENLLSVALSASMDEDNPSQVTVTTDSNKESTSVTMEFNHFDARFDLPSMVVGPADKLKAEMGMLELLVSKRHIESQQGELVVFTDVDKANLLRVTFPKIDLFQELTFDDDDDETV